MYMAERNFPNAEKSEHVVHTISIEVGSHGLQTRTPPGVSVFFHLLPIVGGEAPVLSVRRKGIGRSTGLTVEVEQMRVGPGGHAVAADAYGNVAFEHNSLCASLLVCPAHLTVQNVLHKAVEGAVAFGCGVFEEVGFDVGFVVSGAAFPIAEVGCVVSVAQMAECGIGRQPVCVVFQEFFVTLCAHDAGSFFHEEVAQELGFQVLHCFIVNFGGLVECARCLSVFFECG